MNYEEGTCIWFGPTYGYIGRGLFTNATYEGQIYVHYKKIERKGLRNPKYRELKPGDVVEFTEGEGFFNDGTQAMNVRVKHLVQDRSERQAVSENEDKSEELVEGRLEKGLEQGGDKADQEIQGLDEEGGGG